MGNYLLKPAVGNLDKGRGSAGSRALIHDHYE